MIFFCFTRIYLLLFYVKQTRIKQTLNLICNNLVNFYAKKLIFTMFCISLAELALLCFLFHAILKGKKPLKLMLFDSIVLTSTHLRGTQIVFKRPRLIQSFEFGQRSHWHRFRFDLDWQILFFTTGHKNSGDIMGPHTKFTIWAGKRNTTTAKWRRSSLVSLLSYKYMYNYTT